MPRRSPHSLAGAYALDALDRGDRTRFERHLRGCAACAREVRAHAEVAATLALAVAAEPPAGLRQRVLGTVAAWETARALDAEIAAVLSAADARTASAATTAGGTATAIASLAESKVVFTSSGLPALAAERVYELWLIGDRGARPAGLLDLAPDGDSVPLLAPGLRAGDLVGITIEPAGGSESPTTTPIVLLTLAA